MNKNNSRHQSQGGGGNGEPALQGGAWRSQLKPDSRQKIIDQIMETLKRHLPFNGEEGLLELKKIAARFEEKIFNAATSETDYFRKVSLKMLTMDTKSQNPIPYNPNGIISSASVIDFEATRNRKRQNEGYSADKLEAKEAELIVAQRALKASHEELRAIKNTVEMLTTNVDLVEERHIKIREAIVEKWMQSETGKASINNIGYFKGFEHAYRAKAGFGEDYLLKNDQFGVIEALPCVDCFSHDLELPEYFRPRKVRHGQSSNDDVVPSA